MNHAPRTSPAATDLGSKPKPTSVCLWHWLGALLLLALSACSGAAAPPTFIAPADTPVMANMEQRQQAEAAPPAPASTLQPPVSQLSLSAGPTATATSALPGQPPEAPHDRAGVRPQQAQLHRMPSIGPQATLQWRPPPMSVPLSIHPDDHYWLSRPLPSDSRNYDLEWYPYGNDVLIPEYAPYRIHRGLDFPNEPGTPVLAAGSGTVVHAGVKTNPLDGISYYGNTVIIKHDWQWQGRDVYTLYAHTLELFVEVGDYVERGQLLAGVGASGLVSGPHLHLEVRLDENLHDNTYNPMLWIAPYEGWGTLAGRVVDREGKFITGAIVSVRPLNVQAEPREQYTYLSWDVKSDPVWQENFVVGDLPAGRYEVTVKAGQTFRHVVEILPGRTNFLEVQTGYLFAPPTATPTPEITDGETIT
ncbi:MAG: peptidoglycan DD-metalloendopeptidase family protein, partial [bacterium]